MHHKSIRFGFGAFFPAFTRFFVGVVFADALEVLHAVQTYGSICSVSDCKIAALCCLHLRCCFPVLRATQPEWKVRLHSVHGTYQQ